MELDHLKLEISFTNNTRDFNSPETITLQITRIVQKQEHQANLLKESPNSIPPPCCSDIHRQRAQTVQGSTTTNVEEQQEQQEPLLGL